MKVGPTGLILKIFFMINSFTEFVVCVLSVRAHFQLKRKSFFTQYTRQITVQKKKHPRACVVATSIRTFVSEFVCHPVYKGSLVTPNKDV
jgi:hypothetical protein